MFRSRVRLGWLVCLIFSSGYANAATSFYKGIAFGPANVSRLVDGNSFDSLATAQSQGLAFQTSVNQNNWQFAASPAVDADKNAMLCSNTFGNEVKFGVPVANGNYQVYIYAFENYKANFHSMNLSLGGNVVAQNLAANLGYLGWAKYGPFSVSVTNQNLLVDLIANSGGAIISGLEIDSVQATGSTPTPSPTPAPSNSFYEGIAFGPANVGRTINGNVWMSLNQAQTSGLNFQTSVNQNNWQLTPSPAVDADTAGMLCSNTYGDEVKFGLPVANGNYQIYLYSFENYQSNFHRMNASLNGQQVASNIANQTYLNWTKYGPFNVSVSNQNLSVDLVSTGGGAVLSGLEIFSGSGSQPLPTPTPVPTPPVNSISFNHRFINDNPGTDEWGGKILANFDADSQLEYVASRGDGAIFYFKRLSNGSWSTTQLSTNTHANLGGVAVDVNRDGLMDFIIGNYWYRNNGNSVPVSQKFTSFQFASIPNEIHDMGVGDFDGDGRLEVIGIASNYGAYRWKIPDHPETDQWIQSTLSPVDAKAENIHGGFSPGGIGDIDGDGDLDIVFPNYWLENVNHASSWVKHPYNVAAGREGTPYGWSTRAVLIDLNGDGKLDIVMADSDMTNGRLWILYNNGNGSSWTRQDLFSAAESQQQGSFHSLAVADFDRDGKLDIFTASQEASEIFPGDGHPKAYVFHNNGNGSFTRQTILTDLELHDAKVGDVDGDGKLDIVSANWATWSGNANMGRAHIDIMENVSP